MNTFLIYIICIPLGFALVMYTKAFYDIVGDWGWANTIFGRAGTYTALKFIGIIFIFFPILRSLGIFEPFLNALGTIGLGG